MFGFSSFSELPFSSLPTIGSVTSRSKLPIEIISGITSIEKSFNIPVEIIYIHIFIPEAAGG